MLGVNEELAFFICLDWDSRFLAEKSRRSLHPRLCIIPPNTSSHAFQLIIRKLLHLIESNDCLSRNYKPCCLGNSHNGISITCCLEFLLKISISLDSLLKGFELLF